MQVDTAGDGRAAMEKLMRNEYDLVITDFKMPQMSGQELYHWIKENRPHWQGASFSSPATRSARRRAPSSRTTAPVSRKALQDRGSEGGHPADAGSQCGRLIPIPRKETFCMKTILVTGGAGYIGSHTLRVLKTQGYLPVCFDNLSTGFRKFAETFPFVKGDLGNPADLEQAFSNGKIDAVIHFASHALVEESCRNPYKYYHDNVLNCLNLLPRPDGPISKKFLYPLQLRRYAVLACAYGRIQSAAAINPYGATKMMVERTWPLRKPTAFRMLPALL